MSERVFKYAQVLLPDGGFVKTDLVIKNRSVQYIGKTSLVGEDCSGKYIIPGLIDIHTHGCMGADHLDADMQKTAVIRKAMKAAGTTGMLATVMTASRDRMLSAVKNAAACAGEKEGTRIWGIYLEGPFFAQEYRGAQHPEHLCMPDAGYINSLQEASSGMIKILSLAPELEGADRLIKESGIKVFLGHTGADYAAAAAAFDAGAAGLTHTFNCMTGMHHRAPGVIPAAFESKTAICECICDGVHVHPAMVNMLHKAVGKDRFCMVSDSIRAAFLPDGEYVSGGQNITVSQGRAYLESGNLAGSTCSLMQGVRNLVSWGVCGLADAVYAASAIPAKTAGVYDRVGSIAPGKYADLVILDKELNVCEVIMG